MQKQQDEEETLWNLGDIRTGDGDIHPDFARLVRRRGFVFFGEGEKQTQFLYHTTRAYGSVDEGIVEINPGMADGQSTRTYYTTDGKRMQLVLEQVKDIPSGTRK